MKLLALTKYSRRSPSSRLRFLQFEPALRAAGIDVVVRALFSDEHLERLFARRPIDPLVEARDYARRLIALRDVGDFDVVWLEGEAFPFLPAATERWIARRTRLVVDYDDAAFHKYDAAPSRASRALLGEKIDDVMRAADTIVAGNAYIARRARWAGARRVELLPTVVDLERYHPVPREDGAPFTVGWIGTPHTAKYLDLVDDALREVVAAGGRVHLVGLDESPLRTPATCIPWSEDTEAAAIGRFDVGIMPLLDAPWERGKCGYKLIQCMAMARPVVASAVGVNSDIVDHGRSGFLVRRPEEWAAHLRTLMASPTTCADMGVRARAALVGRFDLASVAPRFVDVIRGR